jgi:hypothetical protein
MKAYIECTNSSHQALLRTGQSSDMMNSMLRIWGISSTQQLLIESHQFIFSGIIKVYYILQHGMLISIG